MFALLYVIVGWLIVKTKCVDGIVSRNEEAGSFTLTVVAWMALILIAPVLILIGTVMALLKLITK
jgi:hypothetical protein